MERRILYHFPNGCGSLNLSLIQKGRQNRGWYGLSECKHRVIFVTLNLCGVLSEFGTPSRFAPQVRWTNSPNRLSHQLQRRSNLDVEPPPSSKVWAHYGKANGARKFYHFENGWNPSAYQWYGKEVVVGISFPHKQRVQAWEQIQKIRMSNASRWRGHSAAMFTSGKAVSVKPCW